MIAVIGGGPVGLYAAYKLALKGNKVEVFEEHSEIGKPVQCTGLLTSEIYNLLDVDESIILNKITEAKLVHRDKSITLKLKKPNLVVDRHLFDRKIASMAESAGVKINYSHSFSHFDNGFMVVNGNKVKADYVIGADGPFSRVAKEAGLYSDKKFVIGSQAIVEGEWKKGTMEAYFDVGMFAWLVPESEKVARIGVIAEKDPDLLLKSLLEKRASNCKALEKQGGFIPVFNPKQKLSKGNVLLAGDAAAHVKAFSFGGIIPGMMAASEIANNIEAYEKNAKKKVHRDLRLNLLMRKAMDKLSADDYERIFELLGKGRAKEIIENENRDFPSKFLFKLVLAEPKLLKYGLKVIW